MRKRIALNDVQKTYLWGIFLLLILCFVAGIDIQEDRYAREDVKQYRVAPGCMANATSVGPVPSCRRETGVIMDKKISSREHNYFLHIRDAGGILQEVFVGPECYNRVEVGQSITAEVWKGNITMIIFPDHAYPTVDNPVLSAKEQPSQNRINQRGLVFMAILFLCVWAPLLWLTLVGREKVSEKSP